VSSVTVIDQLVIKLGLDPRDFTKGEKQVAADVLKTQQTVERSTGSMSKQLTGLATRWIAVGTAVALVKKAVNAIDDVANRTRQLGIDAKNYDVAADRLRNFENAMVMMGGNAEATRQSVSGFQKAMFDLAYNGQISDSLVMLGRLGVQFQDASGHARKFQDVVLDTADAIGKAQEQGMTRADAFQYLQQSGFDAGTSQLILSGRANIQAEQARQGQRFQVDGKALGGAENVVTSRIDKEQQIDALGVKALGVGAGSIQATINQAIAHPTEALNKLGDAASRAGTVFENWALKAAGTTRGLRNNNPGNLKAVKGQRRDREGFAVFDTMEEGIRHADAQIGRYESQGITTAEGVVKKWAPAGDGNDVAAYLRDIQKTTGIKPGEDIRGQEALLESGMFKHESGGKAPSVEDIADILTMHDDMGPMPDHSAPPTPGAQGGSTYNKNDVHIDNITVNTQAKDADKLASDMDAAMQRKLMASHAEPGQQ
jgi:hypothetical protein